MPLARVMLLYSKGMRQPERHNNPRNLHDSMANSAAYWIRSSSVGLVTIMPRVRTHSLASARSRVASPRRGAPTARRSERTEPRHPFPWPAAVTLTLFLTLTPGRPAWPQTVQGTVLDAESGVPISMANVALLATDDSIVGRHVTDKGGRFVIRAPEAGSYWLRATRIGYAPFTTDTFALETGQDAVTELRLRPSPTPLDPIEVVVEERVPWMVRVGFYKRQAKGFGQFRTPEDLEALHPIFPEDLFHGMSGVRVQSNGWVLGSGYRPCALSVTVDGMLVQRGGSPGSKTAPSWTDLWHVNDIEAIEVYPRPGGVPAWLSGTVSPCGAILIWTKGHLR